LHHALVRLAEVCDEIVVVLGPEASVPALPDLAGVRLARDDMEGQGPLAGIAAALRTIGTTFAIVAAGDMPELQRSVLALMLGAAADADAVALADDSDVRPLPCVVRVGRAATIAPALLRTGRASVRALLDQLHVTAVDEETWTALDPERRTLFDVDEPDDLA
jgi:molybdopterin-guanine dinucleotide biosynthesis protein A